MSHNIRELFNSHGSRINANGLAITELEDKVNDLEREVAILKTNLAKAGNIIDNLTQRMNKLEEEKRNDKKKRPLIQTSNLSPSSEIPTVSTHIIIQ